MANLFWGAFFVFVNIDLNLEYCRIGLIPEFIGYILLIKWINRIREDEKCIGTGLNTAKGWLIFLGVVSGIDYCLALLGIALQISGVLSIILTSILIGISCYCWIKMINAVSVMESCFLSDFKIRTLQPA